MKYDPKENGLIVPGEYEASITLAAEKVSQAGNEMIALAVRIYGPDGQTAAVDDYLVPGKGAWKIKHFCESAGLNFDRGELTEEDCVGRNVRVVLEIKKQDGYPDKNVVKDYIKRNGAAKPLDPDGDIPF